jgi:hypothetical protein
MRDRHLPRLCRSCRGPMARQEDTCWRCGARWAAEEQPPTILCLPVPAVLTITGGDIEDAPDAASLEADRWVNEGGTFAAPDRAVAPLARVAVDERRAPEAAAPGRRSTPKGRTPQCGDGAPGHVKGAPGAAHESERARTPSCWQRPIAGGGAPAILLHRPPSPDRSRVPRHAPTTRPDAQLAGPLPLAAGKQPNSDRIADGADLGPEVYRRGSRFVAAHGSDGRQRKQTAAAPLRRRAIKLAHDDAGRSDAVPT